MFQVAQIAASTLEIDLSLISVKKSNTIITPNNMVTAGNLGSDCCTYVRIYTIILKYLKENLVQRVYNACIMLDNILTQNARASVITDCISNCCLFLGNNGSLQRASKQT